MTQINAPSDRQALEALLIDNPDWEALEGLLGQFNIFEAVGVVRHELRHSDFLAFLLDPNQPHGLGEAFAKRLLQSVLRENDEYPPSVTPLELDLWELDGLEVRREWRNIDILLLDEAHCLAVIIENKVDSFEHSNQLPRYWQIVEENFPDWAILAFFLTPDGEPPSDNRYLSLSYTLIYNLLIHLTTFRSNSLSNDVLTLITHYTQMLRRHIMSDSDIAELCRRIYRKHKHALDLIFEHRPDLQGQVRELLEQMVQDSPSLTLAHSNKNYIRFLPEEWNVTLLRQGEGWVPEGYILLFEFTNRPTQLGLKLTLGPGPEALRKRLFELGQTYDILNPFGHNPNKKWNTLFRRALLTAKDFEGATLEDLTPKVHKRWELFVTQELPKIRAAFEQESWIWETSITDNKDYDPLIT